MSPEQHRGSSVDARSDQFSFAVSAWQVLFGAAPFSGSTTSELAAAVLAGKIDPPPEGAGIPATVEPALRRALEVDPARRFPDLEALLRILDRAAAAKPRRRIVWLAGALATLSAGGIAFVMSRGAEPQGDASGLRELIQQHIRRDLAAVQGCYDAGRAAHPDLAGGVVYVSFEIASTGRVISTRIKDDPFHGAGDVATCVAALSLRWAFPPRPGAGTVTVVYPFTFGHEVETATLIPDGAPP